jgi:hypothetical protein
MTQQRFTVDGDVPLERHLEGLCREVLESVQGVIPSDRLQGVVLGGGYGRGEGGVLRTSAGEQPYNDLEYYVFVRGNAVVAQRRWHAALHALGEQLSPQAGLEVEFKIMTQAKLRRSEPCMFYYDLVMGHRRLLGGAELFTGCEHHRDASRIPLHEATRLLMNRCSGLLFSAERLARRSFEAEDADFVGRNLAKAQLALGDVVLAAHGQYDWSCRRRQERLQGLPAPANAPWLEAVRTHHRQGVEFKLYPRRSGETRQELAARHRALVDLGRDLWLWLETRRLGREFSTLRAYALSPVDKCPETHPVKNVLLQWQHFGRPRGAPASMWFRYPRQRLFHALAWLLWEPELLTVPTWLDRVQQELHSRETDRPGLVKAYQRIFKTTGPAPDSDAYSSV